MDVEKKKMMQEENAKPNQYMDNYKVEWSQAHQLLYSEADNHPRGLIRKGLKQSR